jgi:hypothetical protein
MDNKIDNLGKYIEKPGDDMGMQTRVWGPAGWLFLHSIAQNFPHHPDDTQKKNYFNFFQLVGDVLPCRYCRESYKDFISQPDTKLSYDVLKDRRTLSFWLYKVHNKVNKKLGYCNPTFDEVWDKYESFRSKCTKSPEVVEKIKKGCTDPLSGLKKKCVIKIEPYVEEKKQSFGKGKGKKQIKLISIKPSNKSDKKLMATFETNGRKKVIHFGFKNNTKNDYTKHKDIKRRNRYIFRHNKDTKTGDPSRAGYLSLFVLWNKPSLQASIADYRRRLSVYNSTGKFPTKIPGYISPGKSKKYQ